MRPKLLSMIAGAAIVISACSSGGPTQAPAQTTAGGGGGGGGSGTTQPPAATTDSGSGGGGGVVGAGAGTAHIEVSGPVSKTGDYDFVPAGSLFGGSAGSSFSFTNAAATDVLTISTTSDGKVVILYGTPDFTVPGTECTTSNWNIGATSASGSFECDAPLIITAAGAQVTGGKVKGNFTVHA
jgi:hypothetical protein